MPRRQCTYIVFLLTHTACRQQVLDQDKKPLLFSLVFGEGIINDAVSIVLLAAVQVRPVAVCVCASVCCGTQEGCYIIPTSLYTQALGPLSQLSPWTVLAILGRFVFLLAASTLLGCVAGLTTSWLLRRLHCESTPQVPAGLTGFHKTWARDDAL